MKNKEKHRKLEDFIIKGSSMVKNIEESHENMLNESTIREANINQHASKLFYQSEQQMHTLKETTLEGKDAALSLEQIVTNNYNLLVKTWSKLNNMEAIMKDRNFIAEA